MKNDTKNLSESNKRIMQGLKLAASRLLEEKKRTGSKLVTMVEGKVVHLTVDEFLKLKKEERL